MATVAHVGHERKHGVALIFPDIVASEHVDGFGISGFDRVLEHFFPARIIVEIVVIVGLTFKVQERAIVKRFDFRIGKVEVIAAEMVP